MDWSASLPDSRLDLIERDARQSRRLSDKVTVELVQEIRRLRSELSADRRDGDAPFA